MKKVKIALVNQTGATVVNEIMNNFAITGTQIVEVILSPFIQRKINEGVFKIVE